MPRASTAILAALPLATAPFVAALFLATACDHGTATEPTRALAGPPRRVISLAPSCTETLIELGLADRLVGKSDYCPELPPGCKAVSVGGLLNPNVEALLALKPDLVLTVQNADDRALQTLRRQGIPVHARDPQSLEQIFDEIVAIGALFGVEPRASELVASLRARIDAVRSRVVARGGDLPTIYVEVDYPDCWTIGHRSFVDDAVAAAGARNLFNDVDAAYTHVSKEEIVARAPRWVLFLHPLDGPIDGRRELAVLDAVKDGRVIADFDRDSLLHSSPRLVRGIELLAERLAPR
jgi:iron complex transport system substrate-binding protein